MGTTRMILVFVNLAACGATAAAPATSADPPAGAPDDPSAPPAATPGSPDDVTPAMAARSAPEAAVKAYLEAALAGEHDAMFALMTAECRDKEKAWDRGFSKSLVDGKIKLKTYELAEPEINADTAQVAVKAVFTADGADDDEGMRFALRQEADGWSISEIR
jgi:hypothetical protein